jgi:hypothetical protein
MIRAARTAGITVQQAEDGALDLAMIIDQLAGTWPLGSALQRSKLHNDLLAAGVVDEVA